MPPCWHWPLTSSYRLALFDFDLVPNVHLFVSPFFVLFTFVYSTGWFAIVAKKNIQTRNFYQDVFPSCVSSGYLELEDASELTARRKTFIKFGHNTFVGGFVGGYVAATNASVFRPLKRQKWII
jgi:hypothetical protein